MKNIAAELSQRATPKYVKQRAKEAAVRKSMEIKDRVTGSPIALGLIGGLVTAGIAKLLLGRRRVTEYELYDDELELETSELKSTLGQKVGEMKHRMSDAVHAVGEKVGDGVGAIKDEAKREFEYVRNHIPSTAEVKRTARAVGRQAQAAATRAGQYAGDEPIVTALGAVAVGAALGFLIPLTDRERRTLEPYREQVTDKLEALHTDVSDAVKEKVDALHDKIVGDQDPMPPTDLTFPKS